MSLALQQCGRVPIASDSCLTLVTVWGFFCLFCFVTIALVDIDLLFSNDGRHLSVCFLATFVPSLENKFLFRGFA
jgi:hypothetical protein